MPQFKDAQEMLDNWMTDQVKLSLSDFGTRKLFDALKRCMWAKTRKSLSNLQFLKETGPQPPSNECLRCTKRHPGGPDTCRSKDRVSWGDWLIVIKNSFSRVNKDTYGYGSFLCNIVGDFT